MKKLYTLFILLGLTITSVFSQQQNGGVDELPGSIKGTVTSSDGTATPYVNIAVKGTGKGAITDTDGKFEIKKVAPGNYTLIVTFVGFEPKEQEVEVRAGEVTVVNINLNETAAQLDEIVVSGVREGYKVDVVSSSLRLQSSLLETPQNIQVVTKDVLRDQQIISMSDGLVRNVSGLVRNEHWGDLYTNITARGSQIQAFRNGFNVVSSYWGPLTEDMSFVDHVEFVKGPAGFMLANGDPSGLYNVVTKKPTGLNKGEASMTVGSYGLYRGAVDLDGKITKDGKLLFRLNVSAQNKESHRAAEIPVTHIYGKLTDSSVADTIARMNYDIHVGAIAGLPGKILAFLASFVAASLPVTGFLIWKGRRDKAKINARTPSTEVDDCTEEELEETEDSVLLNS